MLNVNVLQVVDVNRSNKGTRSGGIGRFSTMVVIGNFAVRSSNLCHDTKDLMACCPLLVLFSFVLGSS
jgi:hypothetical protein